VRAAEKHSETGEHAELSQHEFEHLPLALRVLISTDGTVTDALHALYSESIRVVILKQELIREDAKDAGASGPLLVRSVLLRGEKTGTIYAQADSHIVWNSLSDVMQAELLDGGTTIGTILQRHRTETFRERLWWGRQKVGSLAEIVDLRADEFLYARCYRISHQRATVFTITERFIYAPAVVS
jgi:chorismate-pyruvate lyase